jgi:hypothetical protein
MRAAIGKTHRRSPRAAIITKVSPRAAHNG